MLTVRLLTRPARRQTLGVNQKQSPISGGCHPASYFRSLNKGFFVCSKISQFELCCRKQRLVRLEEKCGRIRWSLHCSGFLFRCLFLYHWATHLAAQVGFEPTRLSSQQFSRLRPYDRLGTAPWWKDLYLLKHLILDGAGLPVTARAQRVSIMVMLVILLLSASRPRPILLTNGVRGEIWTLEPEDRIDALAERWFQPLTHSHK